MKTITRKEEIIEVAALLFKEKGYSAVSMRDIAAKLNMKAASLYNHIHSKEEILAVLILEVAEAFTQGMETVQNSEISSLDKVVLLIEQHIEITLKHARAMAALNNDWVHLRVDNRNEFVLKRDAYEMNFRKIIQKGISRNEFKPLHPEVILFSILSTLRNLHLWHEKRGKLEVNVLKKEMAAVLINGIV